MMYLRQAKAALETLKSNEAIETAINCIEAAFTKHQITQKIAAKRKAKFTVDSEKTENPFCYSAGGATVEFHYYNITPCGKMAVLMNKDKVRLMTLQVEALQEFYSLVD